MCGEGLEVDEFSSLLSAVENGGMPHRRKNGLSGVYLLVVAVRWSKWNVRRVAKVIMVAGAQVAGSVDGGENGKCIGKEGTQ